jgi:hypothetical protein
MAKDKIVAEYQLRVNPPEGVWTGRGGDWYQISPVKGARISGTVQVGMTSHEANDHSGNRTVKVHSPAMWVDLSPSLVDKWGGSGSERLPLTVNGKEYVARFGGRVEFLPSTAGDYRREFYRVVEVGGRDYLVSAHIDSWDGLSDSARSIVYAVLEAIAAEYVTDSRWHDQQTKEAHYAMKRKRR